MRLNVKNLFIFATIYSGIYGFLIGQFSSNNTIKNYSSFNFLNLSFAEFQLEGLFGGINSYYFDIFGYILNMTFLLYIFVYASLPFYFIIEFFNNIILLISYEIQVIQYPIQILPYGIGNLISGIFYIMIIILIITGIKIVQSGFSD